MEHSKYLCVSVKAAVRSCATHVLLHAAQMSNSEHFYASNATFVNSFDKGDKPLPPARQALVLTCMDARLHPEKALGLEVGSEHGMR